MNIQIFGLRKSFDTKKAERWFKERRIKYVGYDALVDRDCIDYRELGIDYLLPQAAEEKLLEYQLFRVPIVRNGKQATVGYCPDVWQTWE